MCSVSALDLRLGPSASAVGLETQKLDKNQLMQQMVELLKDQDVRVAVFQYICETDFGHVAEAEAARARAGQPASSRPEKVEAVPNVAAALANEKAAVGVKEDCEQVYNSSTHRKEHARLTRRMATIDSSQYPEMVRMWSGTRQDSVGRFSRFRRFPGERAGEKPAAEELHQQR